MTVHPIDTEALRRLADAATEGPWEAQDYDDNPGDEGSCVLTHEPERGTRAIAYAIAYPWTTPESCNADAEFIAAARTAVPALLDALAAAEHRATRAEARIQAVRAMCDAEEDPDQWPPRPVMHGGEPFPASLMVDDIRRVL